MILIWPCTTLDTRGIFQAGRPHSKWTLLVRAPAGYTNVPRLWPTLNYIQPYINLNKRTTRIKGKAKKTQAKCVCVCVFVSLRYTHFNPTAP